MGPQAHILPCGRRLHLQHGPIDLIIGADGERHAAFRAAKDRFETVLQELMPELGDLRCPMAMDTLLPQGAIANRMDTATRPFARDVFVTRMASVAGAVADTILNAMTSSAVLSRAYVNNGGDIAIHLTKDQSFKSAMIGHDGTPFGEIKITDTDPVRGIATSGRHGSSHSLGIADSVTVLAATAATADVAATLIANAVDLPDHPAIHRKPACDLDDTSDLGARLVVTDCGVLTDRDKQEALAAGAKTAQAFQGQNLIFGAALFFQGGETTTRCPQISLSQRTQEYA